MNKQESMITGEKIKNAYSTLTLFFFTVILIPIQVFVFYSGIAITWNPKTQAYTLLTNSIPFVILFLLLPIVYCIPTSARLFNPKRIISPFNIQIGTWVIIASLQIYELFYAVAFPSTTYSTYSTSLLAYLGSLAFLLILLIMVLVVLGAFQLLLVRWVVGPNLLGLDRKSYRVDGSVEAVDKILDCLSIRDFNRTEEEGKILYKLPIGFSEQVLIVLGPESDEQNASILATVAYHKGLYTYEKSEYASDLRDSIIYEINGRLIENDPSYEISQIKETELKDNVSTWANLIACSPTRMKTEKLEDLWYKIPSFYKALIVLTGILIGAIMAIFFTQYYTFDFGTFISAIVFLIFAIFAEAGIPLRDEIKAQLKQQKSKKEII